MAESGTNSHETKGAIHDTVGTRCKSCTVVATVAVQPLGVEVEKDLPQRVPSDRRIIEGLMGDFARRVTPKDPQRDYLIIRIPLGAGSM